MKSMTGFGAAETKAAGRTLAVEITSINSKKGLDLQFSFPRDLASLEVPLRAALQKSVVRGRVQVDVVSRRDRKQAGSAWRINHPLLQSYREEVRRAARAVKAEDTVSLEFLLRLPGVMEEETETGDASAWLAPLQEALDKAVRAWDRSREREGVFLARDLAVKFRFLGEQLEAIEARKAPHLEAHRQALLKRLEEAGLPVPLDDERILRELALFADRSDVSEETTRLRAHFVEARRLLKSGDPAGRNLDFLLQEIGREINTIGSKGNDVEISRRVVAMKTELEKIREQVQNLE